MSDVSPTPPLHPPAAETNGQLIVALAIVAGLVVLGLALVWVGNASKEWSVVAGVIGTIVGALAAALNAPTGIASVLRAGGAKPAQPENAE